MTKQDMVVLTGKLLFLLICAPVLFTCFMVLKEARKPIAKPLAAPASPAPVNENDKSAPKDMAEPEIRWRDDDPLAVQPAIDSAGVENQKVLAGKCIAITAGDTIRILVNNRQRKIRIAAIDTPESRQAFGTVAKNFTAEFCFGKECKVKVIDRDRYGRDVGFVDVDGKDLSRSLLKAGLAWHFKRYDQNPELAELENKARMQGSNAKTRAVARYGPCPALGMARRDAYPDGCAMT